MTANTFATALLGTCMLAAAASTVSAEPAWAAEAPEPAPIVILESPLAILGGTDLELLVEDLCIRWENSGIQTAESGFDGTTIERTLGNGPAETVEVPQGASVRLVLHAPEGTEIHLHGYDVEGTAGQGTPAVMTFRAERIGRFPVEAHGVEDALGRTERVLIYIEVRPE